VQVLSGSFPRPPLPDDTALVADGSDATRVVLRVTDEFDNIRPYASDPIVSNLQWPAELIGAPSPFAALAASSPCTVLLI
jgi:beta-galactosidase